MDNFDSIDDAYRYIDEAEQSESELRAEYGSGCVSLGYDPYEWGPAYDGYCIADDARYAAAKRFVAPYEADIASRMEMLMSISPDVPAADPLPF